VRLPAGAGRWPRLVHFLNDPESWHKVDLVRRRDSAAPGGRAYEAHLMVLTCGYASPATRARRRAAAEQDRIGGVDGNVSNLSIVSFPNSFAPADGPVRSSRVELTDDELAALHRAQRKARGRKRALDRSRRTANPDQYQPSKRQQARTQRRAAAALPAKRSATPRGARVGNKAGVPKQAYRRDTLSGGYRMTRARIAEAAATAAAAKDHRARRIAAQVTADHGANLTVEDPHVVPPMGARPAGHHPRTAHRRPGPRTHRGRRTAPARVDVHNRAVATPPVRRTGHQTAQPAGAHLPGVHPLGPHLPGVRFRRGP
jgi:hypothetical protein